MDLTTNELVIDNAYKDFIVYDENMKPIGHRRCDDKLKTVDSYRRIPLYEELKNDLLKHQEEQKEKFKNSVKIRKRGKRWSEKEYIFLGRTYRPYVPGTLSSAMPKFCKKYNLPRITPYALRKSFATLLSEKGVEAIVTMKILGHASFNTTERHYIRVTSKRKREAMKNVYSNKEKTA